MKPKYVNGQKVRMTEEFISTLKYINGTTQRCRQHIKRIIGVKEGTRTVKGEKLPETRLIYKCRCSCGDTYHIDERNLVPYGKIRTEAEVISLEEMRACN